MPSLQILQSRIDYHFNNASLLELALTHRSFSADNNERLEFLGDSLLNMVIAEALFRRFPTLREGELSRIRAGLVNGVTLAQIGQAFELGELMRLGAGENNTGGRQRDSILADAVEAVIGAIFLDADFDTCRRAILAWYDERLEQVNPKSNNKDAKTRLQELLQARKQPLPEYVLLGAEGAEHEQLFSVACRVAILNREITASGRSRRRAEQAAAELVLQILQDIT